MVEQVFDKQDSRAHWLRTEGMVIFDAEFRQSVDEVFRQITDAKITDALITKYAWLGGADATERTLQIAHRAGELVNAWPNGHIPDGKDFALKEITGDRLRNYTHSGLGFGLLEGLGSITHFPLNLIDSVQRQLPRQFRRFSYSSSLFNLANVLRSEWFQDVCHTAAFTSNGYWKSVSTREQDFSQEEVPEGLQFVFTNSAEGLIFGFTPEFVSKLHSLVRQRNRNFLMSPRSWSQDDDERGTTSGCPVRHDRPHFTESELDRSRLVRLAAYYATTPEQITAPRPETAISYGINHFASLLERVAVIDESIAPNASPPLVRPAV